MSPVEQVTLAAQLVTACAIINILCWIALIYMAVKVCKQAEAVRDLAHTIANSGNKTVAKGEF